MRLIIVDALLEQERQIQNGTVEAQLEIFEQYRVPPVDYCILSHRWMGNEVKYEEVRKLTKIDKRDEIRGWAGYQKVLRSCEQAKRDGLRLLWVDTCCIDFENGPETSEAINSMFQWYRDSRLCYTYLHDVCIFPTKPDKMFAKFNGWPEWFSRGWTLQELVAPSALQFFNKDWECIGDKQSLAPKLAEITKVPLHILRDGLSSHRPSVAQIMSWAADRGTKCIEDRAYSLLGLLGINMPTLYGEEKGAFQRLQLEIMRVSNDQSIFAWKDSTTCNKRWSNGVLADDPDSFRDCHDVIKIEPKEFYKGLSLLWDSDSTELVTSQEDDEIPTFTVANGAIQIRLPLLPYHGCPSVFLAALACRRENDPLPMTIGLTGFGSNYYRYSGAAGPLQLLPQYRRLYLAYRDERPQDITFKLDDRTVPYYGFTRSDVYPRKVSLAGNSFTLSSTSPLAIISYGNSTVNASFAVAFGFCFGQDWVHVICDEQAIDAKKVWNAGAEYARIMAEVRFGERGRPYYVKHEPLPHTIWTVRVICGRLEESSDRRVTVDVLPLPGGYWKTLGWEPVYDIEDNIDMPCLMKKTSWIGERFDSHALLVDSVPKVFNLAHGLQEVELGDYGIIAPDSDGIGYFERRGNIFEDLKSLARELAIDPDDPGVIPVVQAVQGPHEDSADTTSDSVTTELICHDGDHRVNPGITLRHPRSLSLPNTQAILKLLKELSTRNKNYSLVTTVVQCSTCYPTDDFKQRPNSAVLEYPEFLQNNAVLDLSVVSKNLYSTPLYSVSDPWVWCRNELNKEVVDEYRRIREEFSITQDKLLRHGEESKEPAFELLKDMFGVKHLRCMVGDITFFEQLASPLSMGKELGTTVSKGNMSGSPKPCVKQLVIALLQAMNGVTHAFQLRQSSGVVEMRHMTHWVATTLGAEFLADISVAFLGAQEAFNDVKSTDGRERKRNSSVADNASVQSLVDEVADLQLQYHKSKNDDERLVLEQDIVGTILLACRYGISSETQQTLLEVIDGVLRYETTDMSTPLLEREERVNCLRFIGDIFEDAFSDAPLDNHFHLRWPMANAKAGISMHKLYLASCSGWKVGGTSL